MGVFFVILGRGFPHNATYLKVIAQVFGYLKLSLILLIKGVFVASS